MEPERKFSMNYDSFSHKFNVLIKSLKKYQKKSKNKLLSARKFVHFYRLADKNGVVNFRLSRIAEEYTDDFFADTGIPQSEKEWYYRRGIGTFKAVWYGLTRDNYNDYISDFDLYNKKNYLMKQQLIKWFDYKLTTYYVLSAFKEYMPRHYFFIDNGNLYPVDAGICHLGSIEDVLTILRNRPIALKSCVGGHGKGFYKIEAKDGSYLINNKKSDVDDVRKLIATIDNYILTDYGIPHQVFRKACGENCYAVMRVVTVFDKDDGSQITSMIIRLSTKESGPVSDYDGCINCGVDLENGSLFRPLLRSGDLEGIIKGTPLKDHPDTGVDLESIAVPNFDMLKKMVKSISAQLSMTPYLVMDIIPTDDGFNVLEINSHGQVRMLEPWYPFRKNKYNLRAFETRDW